MHFLISGTFFSFFREVGLDEKETGILLQKNPALALTSLDSIRARIRSLSSLGIDAFTLSYLISKCPSLLTAEEIDPFVCFLHDELEGSIDSSQLKRLFATIEPRLLVGFDQKVRLLLQRGVPFEKILYILNSINLYKALCVKPLEEIDKTITFLSRFGGIDLVIRRPTLLNFDLESQLIPRVGILTKLGGGNADAIGAILRKLPAILSYSVDHVKGHVEFFRSFVGLNNEEIFKIFLVFPNVVSASRDRKLQPRMVFLKQCGLNSNEIFKFLIKAPCFMGLSFEGNLAYKLACLVKIGYRYRTKDLAGVLGSVTRTSCENLQKVIGLFLSYGFSFDDIVAMSKKHPQILQYNHSSLEKKMEYLIEDMGREVGELLAFPAFLGYKLDDRIKARYELKREILGDGMSLNKLLCVSADRFLIKKKEKKSAPLIGE